MKTKFALTALLYSGIVGLCANSFPLISRAPQSLFILIPVFLLTNLFAGVFILKADAKRLRVCCHGAMLLSAFCISATVSIAIQISRAVSALFGAHAFSYGDPILCLGVHLLIFWNGIICVYLTSTQLGIRLRLIGIVCGMIPVVNVVVLLLIIHTVRKECLFEATKEHVNALRVHEQLCNTKYPILLVHGIFFRDSRYFNYWGRIPRELETHGARIFYGHQPSAAPIVECAEDIKTRIEEIVAETGADKVNIIAHSKGGLDSRYAIAFLGIGHRVASLTTVNTPHRGCQFADYLLRVIPDATKEKIANAYDSTLKRFGEADADFLGGVSDLTDTHCRELDRQMTTPDHIFCQSVGSILPKATRGKFPMNVAFHLVKYFDGENDGLVSENSFRWGEKYTLLRPTGKRGISHGDMIDLNRENIAGFDVREFYVTLVNDLKNRGL